MRSTAWRAILASLGSLLLLTTTAAAAVDTDGDQLADDWEIAHFGNLSRNGTGDLDGDGLTDAGEFTTGLDPTRDDSYEDADGDRYPNIFEFARGSDPHSDASRPNADYVVNAVTGNQSTTDNVYDDIQDAIAAATSAGQNYRIIGIDAGTYLGARNRSFTLASSYPKLMLIGLGGAAKTIIDGEGSSSSIAVQNRSVLASLTIRNLSGSSPIQISGAVASGSRFVDLIVRDNFSTGSLNGVFNVSQSTNIEIVSSSIFGNTGLAASSVGVYLTSGARLTFRNSILYNPTILRELYSTSNSRAEAHYSLIRSNAFGGEGNVPSTDPLLRADGRLLPSSPVLGRGRLTGSHFDMDLESRPQFNPDIGADQRSDFDEDGLADSWELEMAGSLTILSGLSQDFDADGRTNAQEFATFTNPTDSDSDDDGLLDGAELAAGTNPNRADSDGDGMLDGFEVSKGLAPLRDDAYDDADGDRYPNIFESTHGTDVASAASRPAPDFLVNAATGSQSTTDTVHVDIQAAITAAIATAQDYRILGIDPGTYLGSRNRNISLASSHPKMMLIGLRGAAATIIDGEGASSNFSVQNRSVLASLTIRNLQSGSPVQITGTAASGSRLVDLVIRNNFTTGTLNGVLYLSQATNVEVVGSTIFNNGGSNSSASAAESVGLYLTSGARLTLRNTIIYNPLLGDELYSTSNSRALAHYSLVRNDVVGGTANVPSVDPELRSDGRLFASSPLRGRGGPPQSGLDLDLELRPATPDIGADQFLDSDGDSLADSWEQQFAGSLTALFDASQDLDGDGRDNAAEFAAFTNPADDDTDDDGLLDGGEAAAGSDPNRADTDGDGLRDGVEVGVALDPLHDDAYDDADGDRYPNIFEHIHGTDVRSAASTPTPDFTVNAVTGNQSTTDTVYDDVQDAVAAVVSTAQEYRIIGVDPGTYLGTRNRNIYLYSSYPKVMLIGLAGAAATIFDGEGNSGTLYVQNRSVISGLTIRNQQGSAPIQVTGATATGSRFVDVVFRDHFATGTMSGVVQVNTAKNVEISGSTLFNNSGGGADSVSLYLSGGAELALRSSIVFNPGLASELYTTGDSYADAYNSLIRNDAVAGFDNVPSADPMLRADGRLGATSPARGRGAVWQSRFDMHLEARPTAGIDVGADQFVDDDLDGLADSWELQFSTALSTLSDLDQDFDADGLTNENEFDRFTDPLESDSDGDGLIDGDEAALGTNPNAADSDRDDMPDGFEDTAGLDPLRDDAYMDADGDRFPNVFEFTHGSNASSSESLPTIDRRVNAATGGASTTDNIYTDVQSAIAAASNAGQNYQIVGLEAGTYTGSGNRNIYLYSSSPKLMLVGLSGAARTILDGEDAPGGVNVQNRSVIASLTIRRIQSSSPIQITGAASTGTRLVDLVVANNSTTSTLNGAIYVSQATDVHLLSSTIFDNRGGASSVGLYVTSGAAVSLTSSILYNPQIPGELYRASNASAEAHHSLVRGNAIAGSNNVPSADPRVSPAGRLLSGSPAIARGTRAQSHLDMDLELRPGTNPDIGADQWTDGDGDGLEDVWELSFVSSLAPLTGTGDFDADGLEDLDEYLLQTNPTAPDTDGDSIIDGDEVRYGLDPNVSDVFNLDTDVNQDGIDDSVGLGLGIALSDSDVDDDGVSNAEELARGTDPLSADSDGDGVSDALDRFPTDSNGNALVVDPSDVTPPSIQLISPVTAELQ